MSQSAERSSEEIKTARTIMRRLQEHLRSAHLNVGAQTDAVGFAEVVYHPQSCLPTLNYVMPRRNTAWVSSQHIEGGLDILRQHGRHARVRFAEGLFPPVFLRALRDVGLEIESETPFVVYETADQAPPAPELPDHVQIVQANDPTGMGVWWYVWRNAYYDVVTTGAEPLVLGHDLRHVAHGTQIDLVLYQHGFPVGVARLTLNNGSAHLLAHAIIREVETPELTRLLIASALEAAHNNGCDLIFSAGETDAERHLLREMGFANAGSMVCYADPVVSQDAAHDSPVAQSVLII